MTYPCGSGRGCSVDWTIELSSPYETSPWKFVTPGRHIISNRKIWESVPRVRAKAGLCAPYAPTNRPPALVCLCKPCWDRVPDLSPSPAQTVGETIYFNTESSEYDDPERELVVKSVACHEWNHYMSFDHKGFQSFSTGNSVDWDEVVTDFLGSAIYRHLYPGDDYKTFYNPNFQNFADHLGAHIDEDLGKFARIGSSDFATWKRQNPELVREIIDYLDDCGVDVREPRKSAPSDTGGAPPPPAPDFSTIQTRDFAEKALNVRTNRRDLASMMVQSYFTDPGVFEAFCIYMFTNAGFYIQMPTTLNTKA